MTLREFKEGELDRTFKVEKNRYVGGVLYGGRLYLDDDVVFTGVQNFWTKSHSRHYNPQPRPIRVGDRVYKKGEHQLMEVTFVGQGIAVCKWFDMHGYEMADTFDLGDLEFANTQVSTLDDHDCTESKKKGWCGEYCEQARKGKCPEGIKAKFPYDDKEEAEKEEIKDFEYDGTWTTL